MPVKRTNKKTCMLCIVMRLWLLTFVLLYFLSDQLFAAELNLTKHSDYFIDVENQYTLQTLIADPVAVKWQSNRENSLNLGFTSHTLWLRIPIAAQLTQAPALVEISWPFLDKIDAFWQPGTSGHSEVLLLGTQGDHIPKSDQFLQHRFYVFQLPTVVAGDTNQVAVKGTLYLKINTTSSILLPIHLWDSESFFYKETRHQILLGFFFGLLAIILIYNLGMWFYVKDHVYVYYVGYLSFICIYIGSLTGLGQQYIWGDSPAFSDIALLIGVLGSFVLGSFFVDSFLQLKSNNPIAHRLIKAAVGIYGLLIIGWLISSEAVITPIGQGLGVLASLLAYGIGIWEWRKGNPDARYFTIAWSILLLGTCMYTLYLAGWLPDNVVTRFIQIVGLAVEMALLSFALGERFTRERNAAKQATEVALHLASEVNKSHEERIRYQQQANEQLEAQVKTRTQELQNTLSRLESANEKLEALSHTDQLTGLRNRRFFAKHYEDEFKRSIRNQHPISLVVLDIDHFKQVNDTYGHLAGDVCLAQVADVIKFHSQRPGDMAVRFGGEEFVIMLPQTDSDGAHKVCEYIREQVEQLTIEAEGHRFKVTISLGLVSLVPEETMQPQDLLQLADTALYQAKANGRNRIEVA